MQLNVAKEVATLQRMGPKDLRARFAEVFGEVPHSRNKTWLVRRIVWRLQALAEGDLSERARQRAAELANDADLRLTPPRSRTVEGASQPTPTAHTGRDDRLPPPGSVLVRTYRGQALQVRVLVDGFEFEGQVYPSLSAVAKAITGSHCNGFLFFKLGQHGVDQ